MQLIGTSTSIPVCKNKGLKIGLNGDFTGLFPGKPWAQIPQHSGATGYEIFYW